MGNTYFVSYKFDYEYLCRHTDEFSEVITINTNKKTILKDIEVSVMGKHKKRLNIKSYKNFLITCISKIE